MSVLFNIGSRIATVFKTLLSSVGASLIGFIQLGIGAVLRTIQDELRLHVNVKQYGALGDGVADDTAAIQAALVYAAGAGKRVFIPAGTYKISANIYCGPNTTIYGEGTWDAVNGTSTVRGTVITSQTAGVYFFYALSQNDMPAIGWPANTNANAAHSISIKNLSIYGNLGTQRGIVIGNTKPVTQINLKNISIRDCLIGVDLVACYGISIDGVNPRSSEAPENSKGFQIGNGSAMTSGSISNCFVFSCDNGIYLSGSNYYPGFSINNIDIDGCKKGVVIGNGTGNIDAPALFNNVAFENSITNDVYIRVATGNIGFRGYMQASGTGTTAACIDASSTGALNLYLSDGRISLVPLLGVASIISGANVSIHTSNWTTAGFATIGGSLLEKAEFTSGVFTPVLTASGGGVIGQVSGGVYTKIGNLVFVTITSQLSSNAGSGTLSFTGLPFSVSGGYHMAHSANYGRISLDANFTTLAGQFNSGATSMGLIEVGSGSGINASVLPAANVQPTAYMTFSGVYMTP